MTQGFLPGAIAKPIAPGANDPTIKPVGLVLHTAVSKSSSLFDFFRTKSGGIESHFYVRSDGVIEQYRSIFREADAQLDGNSFTLDGKLCGFVSVETEGLASDLWTDAQLAAIKKIAFWVHSQSAFPWRVCPAWNSPGIGYHTMWGSPSHWTPVAKSCPGPKRILQFRSVIVPWIESLAAPPATKPSAPAAGFDEQHIIDLYTGIRNQWTAHRTVDRSAISALQKTGSPAYADAAAAAGAAIDKAMRDFLGGA